MDIKKSGKRQDVLRLDDYYMGIAFLSGMRSKDPNTQVGACIVNEDKRIVGIGYNGMPNGCSDDELPWNRDEADKMNFNSKYPYVCHAELNAIVNKYGGSTKGCTIYVSMYPCNECAKVIIQSGITKVVYASDKNKDKPQYNASKRILDMANVFTRKYEPKKSIIEIDFSSLDSKPIKPVLSGSTIGSLSHLNGTRVQLCGSISGMESIFDWKQQELKVLSNEWVNLPIDQKLKEPKHLFQQFDQFVNY